MFKFVALMFVTALILGAAQFAPGIGVAAAGDLDILVDGVLVNSYTYADLEEFTQYQYAYSGYNTYPSQRDYVAKGPRLQDILLDIGVMGDAETITFTASDGLTRTFTKEELIEEYRISSYEIGRVPTILALLSASGTDPSQMTPDARIHLVMGQRNPVEQTDVWKVRYTTCIDVATTPPGQWDIPTAEISGHQVTLHHPAADLTEKNNFGVKIYYTTDGTNPTINSNMFNVSAWVLPNPPIELNPGTNIIKAIVIGPGYANSDVATFEYTV